MYQATLTGDSCNSKKKKKRYAHELYSKTVDMNGLSAVEHNKIEQFLKLTFTGDKSSVRDETLKQKIGGQRLVTLHEQFQSLK